LCVYIIYKKKLIHWKDENAVGKSEMENHCETASLQ